MSSPSFEGVHSSLLDSRKVGAHYKPQDLPARPIEKGRLRPLEGISLLNSNVVVEETEEQGEESPHKDRDGKPQGLSLAGPVYSTPNSMGSSPSKFFTNQSFKGKLAQEKRARMHSNSYQSSAGGGGDDTPFHLSSLSTPLGNASYTSNEFWMKKVDTLIDEKRNYIKMNSETRKEILETQRENDLLRGLLKQQEKVIDELKDKKDDNNSRIPAPSKKDGHGPSPPTLGVLDLRRLEKKGAAPPPAPLKSARKQGLKTPNNNSANSKKQSGPPPTVLAKAERLRSLKDARKAESSPVVRQRVPSKATARAMTRPKRKPSNDLSNPASVVVGDLRAESESENKSQISISTDPEPSESSKLQRPKNYWEQKAQNPTPRAGKTLKPVGLRYKSPMSGVSKSASGGGGGDAGSNKFPRNYGKSILEKYAVQEEELEEAKESGLAPPL